MERLLRVASPLGLYAEEFDVETGYHLGQLPAGLLPPRPDRGGRPDHPGGAARRDSTDQPKASSKPSAERRPGRRAGPCRLDEGVGRRGHRLERGEAASRRHPDLRVRVGRAAAQLDRARPRPRTRAGGPGRGRRGRRTSAGRSASASAGSAVACPVGMPSVVEREVVRRAGSRSRHRRRGVPGTGGTGATRTRSAPAGRPVGTTWCAMSSSSSRAATATSMRCGNGNAGASTSMRRPEAGGRHGRRRRRPASPALPTRRPWIGSPFVVGAQRERREVDGRRRRRGTAERPAGSPTAPAAGGRRSARAQRARRRRAGRGAPAHRYRSDTPVMPTPGRNVAGARRPAG